MSLGLWPEAVPFDPDGGTALQDLRERFGAGRLPAAVLLVRARSLRNSDWPARAAIGLARSLASERAVVLADLDFEAPSLHVALDQPNGEGLADAIVFGASLDRVVIRPPGEAFEFLPAGAYAPDPSNLLVGAGGVRILSEIAARGTMFLGYAPLGAAGLDEIAARIPEVIVLAAEDEVAQTVAVLPESIRLAGVLRPPDTVTGPARDAPAAPAAGTVVAGVAGVADAAAPGPESAEAPIRTAKDEAREALMADLRAKEKTTRERAGATGGSPPEGPGPAAEPAVASAERARARPRRWRGIVAVLGIVGVLAVVGWFAGRRLASGRNADVGLAAPIVAGGPSQPAGVVLGYSLAVESYDRLPLAHARADSLARAEPGLSFWVAPIRLDEAVFFRVMAGPMRDSASAAGWLAGLVDRGLKTAATDWDVRPTPLAFLIDRHELREDAERRVAELRTQGVPAYVIEVPYTSGPSRYHVYAGAYATTGEAVVMRELLRGTGIADTLVLRVGRSGS